MPPMRVERVGYGAGDRDSKDTPNVAARRRRARAAGRRAATLRVVVIECEIDDMNPQIFGALMDSSTAAGALDVFYSAVQMKKNRPGTLMTIVARPERPRAAGRARVSRNDDDWRPLQEMARECLDRETVSVETPLGHGPLQGGAPRRAGC